MSLNENSSLAMSKIKNINKILEIMNTTSIIATVVILILPLIYYFFFRPSVRRERRLRKKNLMNKPYSTKTKVSLQNSDINYLERDKEYSFDISVEIIDSLNRKELLNSFSFVVSSPKFEVLGESLVILSFDKDLANSSFKVIPKDTGKTVLHVNLLQNYNIIDQITIDLIIV